MSWTEDEDRNESINSTQKPQSQSSLETSDKDKKDPNKEIWSLLEKTLSENLIEKRRARRWKIFFRFTSLAIFLAIIGTWFAKSNFQEVSLEGDVVAMIPMRGVIGADNEIESSEFVGLIDAAYQNPRLKVVVIEMNSPGGSPVHSGIIYDAIRTKEQNYSDCLTLEDHLLIVMEKKETHNAFNLAHPRCPNTTSASVD